MIRTRIKIWGDDMRPLLFTLLLAPAISHGQSFVFRCSEADGVTSYASERMQGATSCELIGAKYGDRWKHLGAGSNGDSVIIDTETIKRTSKGAQAWVQYLHLKNQQMISGRRSYITAQREEYNCLAMTVGTISSIEYDEKKNVLNSVSYPYSHQDPIVPDSIGEMSWKYICSNKGASRSSTSPARP